MRVISVNIGEKKKVQWRGQEIYTGIFKFPTDQPIELGLTDVEKDNVIDRRYHGGVDKACYLYSADHYTFWKKQYPDLNWSWGMFGENLTVVGLNEAEINVGDILKIGEVEVQVTQPRQPCFKLGIRLENSNAEKKFVEAEMPGIYVRVLKAGKVNTEDVIEIIHKSSSKTSVKDIYHYLYHPKFNIEKIKKAVEIPELAESCRADLKKLV